MEPLAARYSSYFSVVYEDNHLIVVNKNAGVLVQGDNTGDVPLSELVKNYLKEKYDKPGNVFCGVTHRLDRPVSGLVILAKTSKSLERVNAMFREKTIQKTYWALVEQKPPKETDLLTNWLKKDGSKNMSKAYDKEVNNSLKAQLTYQTIKQVGGFWLVEIQLHTGRHHQIRVQLAHIGCIIVGDLKYRAKISTGDGSICLHARQISFSHPVTKDQILINAPLPRHRFWQF